MGILDAKGCRRDCPDRTASKDVPPARGREQAEQGERQETKRNWGRHGAEKMPPAAAMRECCSLLPPA